MSLIDWYGKQLLYFTGLMHASNVSYIHRVKTRNSDEVFIYLTVHNNKSHNYNCVVYAGVAYTKKLSISLILSTV